MTQPAIVTDELFAHLRDSPKFPIEDFNPLEELEDNSEPDDSPYNDWERWPWRWPGQ